MFLSLDSINSRSTSNYSTFAMVLLSLATTVAISSAFAPKAMSSFLKKTCTDLRLDRVSRLMFSTGNTSPEGMPMLPRDVVQYSQVPKNKSFTASTVPRGLLKDHTTKAGTWGVINVSQGCLEYKITDDPTLELTFELRPEQKGIIEPQKRHHVKPLSDDVQFVVEFHRKPGTGPVDEKREGL
jgi:tellurite resistance-related uncharacterized protein